VKELTPEQRHERALALAAERVEARSARDFARADELREQVRGLGYIITDTANGPALEVAPAFLTSERAHGDGSALGAGARVLIAVVVDGWVADAAICVEALLSHESDSCAVVIVDVGNQDGVGEWAQSVATAHPTRVQALHLPATAAHWSQIHRDLISRCHSDYYCVLDPSTVVTGPAVTIAYEFLDARPEVLAAGWRGANVNIADDWRSVDAAAGEVDALLSYFMVVRTAAAQLTGPDAKARFYRNADIEWCLALRAWHVETHGMSAHFAALDDELPASQARHHGYHDSEPVMRDRESRKTYDRILQKYRGRTEILKPQS